MSRAIGLAPRFACGEFDRAIVQEGLYSEAEGQIARPGKVSKFVEQAKSKEIDPDPVQRFVLVDRPPVARLPFRDPLAKSVELSIDLPETALAHLETKDRVASLARSSSEGDGKAAVAPAARPHEPVRPQLRPREQSRYCPLRLHDNGMQTTEKIEAGLADILLAV